MSRLVVRRLYSTFAGGWPALGLLLMRLVVGGLVLWHVGARLASGLPSHIAAGYSLLALGGALLIAGLWTPVAAVVVAAAATLEFLVIGEALVARLLVATIGGALALLGPGRVSIDARLFGWKRIEAPPRRAPSSVL